MLLHSGNACAHTHTRTRAINKACFTVAHKSGALLLEMLLCCPQLNWRQREMALQTQKVRSSLNQTCEMMRLYRTHTPVSCLCSRIKEEKESEEPKTIPLRVYGKGIDTFAVVSLLGQLFTVNIPTNDVLSSQSITHSWCVYVLSSRLDQDPPCQQLGFDQWGGTTGPATVRHYSESSMRLCGDTITSWSLQSRPCDEQRLCCVFLHKRQ